MRLRDAKAQVEREHPDWDTDHQIAAIRELRATAPPHKPSAVPQALALALIPLMIWATVAWWHQRDVLILAGWILVAIAVVTSGNAYERARKRYEAAQRPE